MIARLKSLFRLIFGTSDEWRENRFPLLWSFISGVMGIFVFPGFSVYVLAWFFLVPFFYALGRVSTWRMAVWCTFAFAFPWYYGILWWLNTLTVFNPYIPFGIVCMPILGMVWMLVFSLPAVWVLRHRTPWLRPFIVAAIWVGFEQTHAVGDLAFPWNFLGHALAVPQMLSIAQWAAVGGVGLLSFFVALTNASLANMLVVLRHPESFGTINTKPTFRRALWSMLSVFVLLNAVMLIGSMRLQTARLRDNEKLLRIAVVQPNMRQLDKVAFYSEQSQAGEDKLLSSVWSLLDESVKYGGVQLCVLPESVMPSYYFVYQNELLNKLVNFSNTNKVDLLFGADNREPFDKYLNRIKRGQHFGTDADKDNVTSRPLPSLRYDVNGTPFEPSDMMAAFVSAWQITAKSGLTPSVYDKMQLVPFGEYAPLLGHIPGFNEFIMMAGSYQRGTDQVLFETNGIKYGAVICFESSFAHLTRGLAQAGAQFITVITNDGWYNPAHLGSMFEDNSFLRTISGSGPQQHLAQSVMRAIETELPVVRAANTGISAIISPYGQILKSTNMDCTELIVTDLSVPQNRFDESTTIYVKLGNWPGYIGFSLILFIFFQIAKTWKTASKNGTKNSKL